MQLTLISSIFANATILLRQVDIVQSERNAPPNSPFVPPITGFWCDNDVLFPRLQHDHCYATFEEMRLSLEFRAGKSVWVSEAGQGLKHAWVYKTKTGCVISVTAGQIGVTGHF